MRALPLYPELLLFKNLALVYKIQAAAPSFATRQSFVCAHICFNFSETIRQTNLKLGMIDHNPGVKHFSSRLGFARFALGGAVYCEVR